MKITVLAENTTSCPNLSFEHGLSLYIETDNHKILFDMGQSDIFEKNALSLGVDLSKVDIAVLSHGHYDHGGGLERFLHINNKAVIYMSEYAFDPHFSSNGYIGLDTSLAQNPRFQYVKSKISVDNIALIPASEIDCIYPLEAYSLEMLNGGLRVPDDFRHELYLEIKENDKRILISGCSHKGIMNIAEYFSPDVLVGGFHFMKIPLDENGKETLVHNGKKLLLSPTVYHTCHCTGGEQYKVLKEVMREKLNYLSTGMSIII